LERGILSGLSLKLTELEFNDMLELAFRMLRCSCVPVRVVAAGVLATAKASELEATLDDSALQQNLAGRTHGSYVDRSLAVKAFLAELEGRKLRPEEVPGRCDDERTIAVIDALRRDDLASVLSWRHSGSPKLDPRTLIALGFDIVPLLTSGLSCWVMAVELNARDCALQEAKWALRHATVRGAALEPLLLEAVGGPDEFREFQVTHGTSLAMTAVWRDETSAWDAELALALYEEGLEQSMARVGEPTHAGSWWRFAMMAPPAKRRKLLNSTKRPRELLELFEVAWANPTQVMKWLVDDSDRLQAWNELGSALDASSGISATQSFVGVDLATAAKVFEHLNFPRPFVEEVLKAFVDGGLDDLAAEVEAKLPPGCLERWFCDWPRLGARALVGGAFKFVTALLRPRGIRVIRVRHIVHETEARLRELGRHAAAAAFAAAFSSGYSDDASEDTVESRRLAVKLRECSNLAK
jgi:hypothetical protein